MATNPAEPEKWAAWEELKLLQAIIARYDEHTIKVKNWAIAIATAIVVFAFATHAAWLGSSAGSLGIRSSGIQESGCNMLSCF